LTVSLSQSSIVDEKVVPDPIPKAAILVGAVDEKGFANVGGGMMNDDIFPPRVGIEGNDVSKSLSIGNDQLLPLVDRVYRFERIGSTDRIDGNSIHLGYSPEGFQRSHLVGDGLRSSGIKKTFFYDFTARLGHWRGGCRRNSGDVPWSRAAGHGDRDFAAAARQKPSDKEKYYKAKDLWVMQRIGTVSHRISYGSMLCWAVSTPVYIPFFRFQVRISVNVHKLTLRLS
jgi:hypothetical protein